MFKEKMIERAGGKQKAPCPTCKREQNCKIEVSFLVSWTDLKTGYHGYSRFRVLECMGCEALFSAKGTYFSEDTEVVEDDEGIPHSIPQERWKYFPGPKWREFPLWFSLEFRSKRYSLASLMVDTYEAANRGSNILAAMGIRTCFDIAGEILGIDRTLTFAGKIDELRRNGHISPREMTVLETITDIGSAAAHRGWMPSQEDLSILLDALETFIHHSIVLPEGLDRLSKKVPARSSSKG